MANKVTQFKQSAERTLHGLASALVGRANLAQRLGKSFGNKRDVYTALGYSKDPSFEDFYVRYKRQDIAKRVIEAPVKSTWRLKPAISESKEEETTFEKAWVKLVRDLNPYHFMSRVDKIAGIGQYGVLFLGFDDGLKPEEEVEKAKNVLYMRPFAENHAQIQTWETDTTNERYGKPLTYTLNVASEDKAGTKSLPAHWSRVIHVAEDLYENDTHGTPRLECVLNRLQDLELIAGGSAEMFWRGAFPGYSFKADEGFTLKGQALVDLEDEIQEFVHDLKRYIRLTGMSVDELSAQVADPSNHFEILVSLISAATAIPKRILLGSERGELASSQDESNWHTQVENRRTDHAEPTILRPFINRLMEKGVLPEVGEDGYEVEWPDLFAPSEKEQAEVTKTKTEALAAYSNAPSANLIIPPAFYLAKFLNLTQDEIDQIEEQKNQMLDEEKAEIEAEIAERKRQGLPPEGEEEFEGEVEE